MLSLLTLFFLGPLNIRMNFRISLSFFGKKPAGYDRDCIVSVDQLGSAVILTILSLLIHECWMSFYLFR